jgi:hypothetical protein
MASGSSCARHERGKGPLDALRRVAFQDVAVERVEGEKALIELPVTTDLREQAAFRRAGIDVVEVWEVARIFQIAESRNAMAFGLIGRTCRSNGGRQTPDRQRAGRIPEKIAA